MSAQAPPSIEEIVAALTARLASAVEIRAHASRLGELADAQEGLARDEAMAAYGEAEGERLYQAVSAIHSVRPEPRSRVAAVPGLVESLRAPWEDAASEPAAAAPAALAARASKPQPDSILVHGVLVEAGDREAAARLDEEARLLAASGDRPAMEARAAKLVGRHRWRRDLLEAAFEAHLAGMPSAGPAQVPQAPLAAAPAPAVVPAHVPDPEDMEFGDGPGASPVDTDTPAEPASAPILRPPVLALGDALPDPGAGWGGRPVGRPRTPPMNGIARAQGPGLFPLGGE